MFICLCVFLCLCCPVYRERPCDGLITRPRSPTVCVKKEISKLKYEARAKERAVQPLEKKKEKSSRI
jgi:hypothetical protein